MFRSNYCCCGSILFSFAPTGSHRSPFSRQGSQTRLATNEPQGVSICFSLYSILRTSCITMASVLACCEFACLPEQRPKTVLRTIAFWPTGTILAAFFGSFRIMHHTTHNTQRAASSSINHHTTHTPNTHPTKAGSTEPKVSRSSVRAKGKVSHWKVAYVFVCCVRESGRGSSVRDQQMHFMRTRRNKPSAPAN